MNDAPATVLTLDVLKAFVDGSAVAIRGRAILDPVGGIGDKVFPPSHSVSDRATTALLATREIDAVRQRVSSVPLPHLASAGPSGVGPDRVGPHLELLRTAPRRVN